MYKSLFFSLIFVILFFNGCTSHNADELIIAKPLSKLQKPVITPDLSSITPRKNIQKHIADSSVINKKVLKNKIVDLAVTQDIQQVKLEKKKNTQEIRGIQEKNQKVILKKQVKKIEKEKKTFKNTSAKIQGKQLEKNLQEINTLTQPKQKIQKNIKSQKKISKIKSKKSLDVLEKKKLKDREDVKGKGIISRDTEKLVEQRQNKKRIQEIIAQLNASDKPQVKLKNNQDDIEKQKNTRVDELIKQINMLNKHQPKEIRKRENKPLNTKDKKADQVKSKEPFITPTSKRDVEEIKKKKTPAKDLDTLPKIELISNDKAEKTINKRLQQKEEDKLYMKKKVIGDKVCRDARGLLSFVCMDLLAIVEDVKDDRIKIRIIDSQCENMSYNGIGLYKNTILWDDYKLWKICKGFK